jgi:hypothetical protein
MKNRRKKIKYQKENSSYNFSFLVNVFLNKCIYFFGKGFSKKSLDKKLK